MLERGYRRNDLCRSGTIPLFALAFTLQALRHRPYDVLYFHARRTLRYSEDTHQRFEQNGRRLDTDAVQRTDANIPTRLDAVERHLGLSRTINA
jgi:hypothetical protein